MSQNSRPTVQINARTVRRGALVFGAGSLLSMAGFMMTTRELVGAVRRYLQAMPVPPGELARHHAGRARTAAVAGASAWRQANGQHRNTGMVDLTADTARSEPGVRV